MKIEMLEDVLHGREQFSEGEVRLVDEDVGQYFCSNGWANDLEGKVETGERRTDHATLTPDSVAQKMNVNGV